MVREGRLPAIKLCGRLRVRIADIEELERGAAIGATAGFSSEPANE
jgi:hypothetical protein